jgi:hypothetical protein
MCLEGSDVTIPLSLSARHCSDPRDPIALSSLRASESSSPVPGGGGLPGRGD